MNTSTLTKMHSDIASDPEVSGVKAPDNVWGFAGYVLAKFGPWGAILIILGAIMWFFTVVYGDNKSANTQLVSIIQQQSATTTAQALSSAAQTRAIESQTGVITDLKTATQGLKFSVDQMSHDIQNQRK